MAGVPVVVTRTPDDKENNVPFVKEPKPRNAGWDFPDIEHRDGVPWFEAPIPRWLHRCSAQTIGWIGLVGFARCACGAIKHNGDRWRDRWWMERNSSRKDKIAHDVPDTPYIERRQAQIDRDDATELRFLDRSSSGE